MNKLTHSSVLVPSAALSAELKASLGEAPALPGKTRVPLPKELVFLMPEPSAPTPTQTRITVPGFEPVKPRPVLEF
ncbi:hypothetical protein KUCAC02_007075 [Chaenocephalus aceratus]|nr:hypothetical protein KUCAC02_007075 [Chaenocephalus aceratus]